VLPVLEKAREALGQDEIDRLVGLPETSVHGSTLYCHGSPGSDMDSFLPDPGEEDERLLEGATAERVVFGHTHLQFERRSGSGIHLVNPGSVGIPCDGDHRAAYAIVHDDGSLELRRAEYDWRAVARAVRERVAELPAKRIEQARFDPV
jgi:diadenosine tetraphosphatase ApaH/serine/threonine PP2A family protein phosphatase